MRRSIESFLFLFPLFACATVNEPFRWDLWSGYRNDRLHWHMQQGGSGTLLYSERYRDLSFWENGLTIQTISHDLVFYLCASYGAFGQGDLTQRYSALSFTQEDPFFYFSLRGWAADASGYVGYAVNLTADRTYKVLLIPLFGYSGHFERLARGNGTPDPLESANAAGAAFYSMSSFLPNHLQSSWYGIYLGGGFQIEPGGALHFKGGYSYHWLNVRLKTDYKTLVALYNPALFSKQQTTVSLDAKGEANEGQTGWAEMEYLITRRWRASLGARIHSFSSNLIETSVQETEESLIPPAPETSESVSRKIKTRWTSLAGWLSISRDF